MILPLFGSLDRINQSLLEAGRDLGASPFQTFRRVTLPLSKPAILAGLVIVSCRCSATTSRPTCCRPRHGRRCTATYWTRRSVSPSEGPGSDRSRWSCVLLVLLPMLYYLRATTRAAAARTWRTSAGHRAHERAWRCPESAGGHAPVPRGWLNNPWRKPRFLPGGHVGVPVLVDRAGGHRRALLVQRRAAAGARGRGSRSAVVLGRPVRASLWHDRRSARR